MKFHSSHRSFVSSLLVLLAFPHCSTGSGGKRVTPDGGSPTDAIVIVVDGGCNLQNPGPDTDGDGVFDSIEFEGDTNGNGVPDIRDPDDDGDTVPTSVERRTNTLCGAVDSDGDGKPDYLDLDSDNDGVPDSYEAQRGTNPTLVDTDGDTFTDLAEIAAGTNPLDGTSGIPESDFFVLLPYQSPEVEKTLSFETSIQKADIYFLIDTTASMQLQIDALVQGVQYRLLPEIGGPGGLIPDAYFGVGAFDDYPVNPYGSYQRTNGERLDRPYYHLLDVSAPDSDFGFWAKNPASPGDIGSLRMGTPNEMPDVVDAAKSLVVHNGFDLPESGADALYAVATGSGLSWPASGNTPAGSVSPRPSQCPTSGHRGYPCFRPGALPIIAYISDASFHEPLPAGFTVPTTPNITAQQRSYGSAIPDAHSVQDAINALNGIGARVITISSGAPSNNDGGYPATQHMCAMSSATGAVNAQGDPLCFLFGGNDLGEVSMAVSELVRRTPQTVSTIKENGSGNLNDFDATQFLTAARPVPGSVAYQSITETSYVGVQPNTTVQFRLNFANTVFQNNTGVAQVFRFNIVVVGNGVARLSERKAYIVVPAPGSDVIIL